MGIAGRLESGSPHHYFYERCMTDVSSSRVFWRVPVELISRCPMPKRSVWIFVKSHEWNLGFHGNSEPALPLTLDHSWDLFHFTIFYEHIVASFDRSVTWANASGNLWCVCVWRLTNPSDQVTVWLSERHFVWGIPRPVLTLLLAPSLLDTSTHQRYLDFLQCRKTMPAV